MSFIGKAVYKMDIKRVTKLRNIDHEKEYEWYRIDNVRFFDTLGKF